MSLRMVLFIPKRIGIVKDRIRVALLRKVEPQLPSYSKSQGIIAAFSFFGYT